MKTTLRPLRDRVLVKGLEEQDEQPARLIIPDTAKEKPQEGSVIARGHRHGHRRRQELPASR
jgi:chaperonin GroES